MSTYLGGANNIKLLTKNVLSDQVQMDIEVNLMFPDKVKYQKLPHLYLLVS